MKKRSLALVLCAVLALGLAANAPAAFAVELDQDCSLTVALGSKGYAEDLETPPAGPEEPGEGEPPEEEADDLTGVVLDLYLVSPAAPMPGYDAYTYTKPAEGFEGLTLPDLEKMDNDSWRAFANAAAELLLQPGEGEDGVLPVTPVKVDQKLDEKIEGLEPGLYLIIARGAGMKPAEYITRVKDAEGTERPATLALSPDYTYTFQPELVSIPSKEAVIDPETGDVLTGPNTANPGEWVYDVAVELKPQRESRYGKLAIKKTLDRYELSEPATFVFSVVGTKDGAVVYENVVSLTFSGAGEMQAELDRIPVGTKVTVTEVYSGASYELTTAGTQEAEIGLELAEVSFGNTYNWTWNRGHGILNQFSFDGDKGSWSWEQDSGGPGGSGGETA